MTSVYEQEFTFLVTALIDLDGIQQSPKYHPEGDALFHSLQVYQCAKTQTSDPELLAAALLHDIGKAADCECHAQWGAQTLTDICTEKVCWLIANHLALLKPRHKWPNQLTQHPWFHDLWQLRRWDLNGRQTDAWVLEPEQAMTDLFSNPTFLLANQ